jgi:hypothetical protein
MSDGFSAIVLPLLGKAQSAEQRAGEEHGISTAVLLDS